MGYYFQIHEEIPQEDRIPHKWSKPLSGKERKVTVR